MTFNRTESGLIAKYLFYPEPVVWVEGPSDVLFYQQIVKDYQCRIEPAGGNEECLKLANALIKDELPYVVILDGDYGILDRKRSPHRRVIFLQRYSTENFLFEKDPTHCVCNACARVSTGEDLIGDEFDNLVNLVDTELRELVVLDVAHHTSGSGQRFFPSSAEQLLAGRKGTKFNNHEITRLFNEASSDLEEESVQEARALVNGFLINRRLVDLIKGHFVFGILRRFVKRIVRRSSGRKPTVDDSILKVMFSIEVWRSNLHPDHKNLKRRLRKAVREVRAIRVAA